jgi:HTH-type transcriptional regulator/antitoxin HigA
MANKYIPFLNIGPGEFIKEELETRNWKQEDLAEILGMSLKSVNKLIMNKQAITTVTAKLLSRVFGQSPQYWMNLDTNYRLRLQKEDSKERDVEIRANIFNYMPFKEMAGKGWLTASRKAEKLENEVKQFWNIPNLDFSFMEKRAALNFRKSRAYDRFNKYYALTWFHMAEQCAKTYSAGYYSKVELQNVAGRFSDYTVKENGIQRLLGDLNSAGVKFFVLSHLQKTYIDGASFLDNSNPVIVFTGRHNRNDNFWFTMAHEIGHVLLHLKKKGDFFIDNLDEIDTEDKEQAADKLAEKMIKAQEILKFFKPFKKYISRERVLSCARDLNLGPEIIVGVLQHHKILSLRNLNNFKSQILRNIADKYLVEKHLEKVRQAADEKG